MNFSWPSGHVTSCFVVSAVYGGRELFGPQSLSISTLALQTISSQSFVICTLMEIHLPVLVRGCQSGNSLQSFLLSEEQNG